MWYRHLDSLSIVGGYLLVLGSVEQRMSNLPLQI